MMAKKTIPAFILSVIMAVSAPASVYAVDRGAGAEYENQYGFPGLSADTAVPIEAGTAQPVDIAPGYQAKTFVFVPDESGIYYAASASSEQENDGYCDPIGRVIGSDGKPFIWNDAFTENDDADGRNFGIKFDAEAGESYYIQVIDGSDQEENVHFNVGVYSADHPQWSVSTDEVSLFFSPSDEGEPWQAILDAGSEVTYDTVPPELHYAWYRCNPSGTESPVGEDARSYKAKARGYVSDEYKVVISDDAGKAEEIRFHVAYEDVEWSLKQEEATLRLLNGTVYLSPEPYIECEGDRTPYYSESWKKWDEDTETWKAWSFSPSEGSNAKTVGNYKVVFDDMFGRSGEIVFHVLSEWDEVSADANSIGEEEYRNVRFTKEAEEVTFKFIPQKDGEYFFTSEPADGLKADTVGRVTDENGETIAQEDQGGREDEHFGIRFSATAGDTYYLQARSYSDKAEVSFRVIVEEFVEDLTWSRIVTEATLPIRDDDDHVTANPYDFIQFGGNQLPPVAFEWEWLDPDSGNYEYMGNSSAFDMYFEGDYRVKITDQGREDDPETILFHVVKDDGLAAAKDEALAKLDEYDLNDYTVPERKQVRKLLKAGRAAVMAAGSAEDVITALKKAEDEICAVKETEQKIKVTPTVILSKKAYIWNGKVRKPAVTVRASGKTLMNKGVASNSNVDLTYSQGMTNVGRYYVKVELKGHYTGSKVISFKINPKGTGIKKLKKGKKRITVQWKRQTKKMSKSRITGCQIQLATNKSFTRNKKTVTVKGYKKTSQKIKKLKGKKKYYVHIRTYKTVKGVKYYSPWSKTKTVKTR